MVCGITLSSAATKSSARSIPPPFSYREHILIWPYTFFLFTWSAAAFGPCFLLFLTWLTEKIRP